MFDGGLSSSNNYLMPVRMKLLAVRRLFLDLPPQTDTRYDRFRDELRGILNQDALPKLTTSLVERLYETLPTE
jgi:hypothetical protein